MYHYKEAGVLNLIRFKCNLRTLYFSIARESKVCSLCTDYLPVQIQLYKTVIKIVLNLRCLIFNNQIGIQFKRYKTNIQLKIKPPVVLKCREKRCFYFK